jgi:hypothetical protein
MFGIGPKYRVCKDGFKRYYIEKRGLFFYSRMYYKGYYVEMSRIVQIGNRGFRFNSYTEAVEMCERFNKHPDRVIIGTLTNLETNKKIKDFLASERKSLKRLHRKGLVVILAGSD